MNEPASLDQTRSDFLAAMPRITRHARVYFRHVHCKHRKADLVQEVVALCWKRWTRLVERQKNPNSFVSTLASFAARAVRCGRRVCGQLKAKDALSEAAQQRHAFTVSTLPQISTLNTNPLADALCETPDHDPARIAAFKIDYRCWRRSHSRRNRQLIDDMMVGNRTKELARKHRLSPARVSQLRRELHSDWRLFTGDEQDAA